MRSVWAPVVAVSAALLSSCVLVVAPSDPNQLLRDMQSALIEHDLFQYHFEATTSSPGAEPARALHGTATIHRLDLSGGLYEARMEATEEGVEGPRSFVAARTRDEIQIADAGDRVAYEASMYSAGSQLVARLEPGLMYVFYDPRSLDEEIAADATWEASLEIGGVPCELVRVRYASDPEDSRWCIGREDKLPRRLEWIEDGGWTRLDLFALERLAPDAAPDFTPAPTPGYRVEHHEAGPGRGVPVPDLMLRLADGREMTLAELEGEVLVFDFWATWCAPCKASLEGLDRTAAAFAGRPVRFFAVNAMESLEPGDPLVFLEAHGLGAEAVLAGDALHAFFAPGNLPALAVVDAAGRTAGVTIGFHGEGSERYVRQLIEQALSAS